MRILSITTFSMLLFCLTACNSESSDAPGQDYLFQPLEQERSGIDFSNEITEDAQHSIINYIYYYNGAGVAAGDINNDGLTDLYFVSNMGENKLYLNKGGLRFEDITATAHVQSNSSWNTGVSMVDINNDGYLDIYLCSVSGLLDFEGRNELFINNGDGTFSEKAAEYGLDHKGFATQAYFFDYDKDNDLDVYIVNHAVHTTLSHGPASAREKRVPLVGDVLLKNEGGKFTDASESAGIYGGVNGYGLSAAIADYNNDGWDDIYVCNDFHEEDYYYLNNQDGTFRESLASAFATISRFSMGSDAADINNDGYPDLITLDMLPEDERVVKESEGDDAMYNMQKQLSRLGYKDQYARNMLQVNLDGRSFQETALFNGVAATDWSWGPLIADYNNDGFQDIFIANGILRRPNDLDFKNYVSNAFKKGGQSQGMKWLYESKDHMPGGEVPNEIYKGNAQQFQKMTGKWLPDHATLSNGALYSDLDNDGDLDLVLNNLNQSAEIYENTNTEQGNYLRVVLNYTGGNKEALGAKVVLYTNGSKQFRQLYKTRGFLSSTDSRVHFGLGSLEAIDSVEVIWPDNRVQMIKAPAVNTTISLAYEELEETRYANPQRGVKEPVFNLEEQMLAFTHSEDNYDDFHKEKLIPYRVSTLGPAVAVADIDGNGYEDVFLGNASGDPFGLYMNTGNGLIKKALPGIEKDSIVEDNAAIFFDADNDNDLDLFVASGIHSMGVKNLSKDRLYLNKNGNFEKSRESLPGHQYNTSTVVAADYDADGDMDLFVGNLSEQGDFGKSVPSFIYKNDGTGNFTADPDFTLESHVTAALWEDIDGNGYPDLIITAEWEAPKIFMNEKGKLIQAEIPTGLQGLWQGAALFDVDADGDKDIVLGNWGLNTRYRASSEEPLYMYHSDFNADGRTETVVAYPIDGEYYPVHSKMDLASQMNFIQKKYPSHKEFALKTVEDIFGVAAMERSRKYEIQTLATGYLENNGGKFNAFRELPKAFQLGPVRNFTALTVNGENCLLVSGNSRRVNTWHGAYNSMKGLLLQNLKHYTPVYELGIDPFDKEIRATLNLGQRNGNLLLVVPNNGEVKTYSYDPGTSKALITENKG